MNLEQFLENAGWDETKAMNLLQDFGVVSDECVKASDVAVEDQAAAIKFLGEYAVEG